METVSVNKFQVGTWNLNSENTILKQIALDIFRAIFLI